MATYQELRTRSQQVRDEQNIGGNTALRVGQLLMDIVKYFNDNDAAASEYLQQHFAMVNDGTQLLNWQQSPIVILHTMGETYDDGDFSALSQGENYYRAGFIMEANGKGGGINGETPKANVLYVNLANDTLYTWNGSSFDAITSGGGGGSISGDDIIKNAYYSNGNLVLIIETESGDKTVTIPVNFDASNYVPTSRTVNGKALSNNITLSQSDIPGLVAALAGKISGIKANGASETLPVDQNGIVELPPAGSAISPATAAPSMDGTAAVGSSAKYAREDHVHPHDTTKLSKSDVSVETQGDGTVDINIKDDTYTINLNHTHENMAKLIVCEESDLPSTLDPATIYAITDSGETEIEKLIIKGMEFAGGGVPDTGEPMISSPSNGSTINLGNNEGSGVSKTITIKGKNLTGDLTVAVGTGLKLRYGQAIDASTVTIPVAQALLGAQVTISYTGSGALDDGSLVIRQGNDVLSSVVVVVVPVPTTLTAIKMTGTQWLQTDYKPNANTEFELDVKFSGFSSSSSGQIMFDCAMNTIADTAKLFRMYYTGSGNVGIKFANEESITNPNTHSVQNVSNDAVNGIRGIIKYIKESGHGTFSCGSSSVETTLKSSTMENALKIGHGRTSNAGADAISNFTEFVIYGFVITENGTTVRNYVPAELDGEAGLYDTITGAFHTSATSSSIIGIE